MPSYLIEAYMPRSRAQEARDAGGRARAAAEQLSHEGTSVRYVRTTFLPDDETCFHLFEPVSADAVEEVSRRAELGRARVSSASRHCRRGERRNEDRRPCAVAVVAAADALFVTIDLFSWPLSNGAYCSADVAGGSAEGAE